MCICEVHVSLCALLPHHCPSLLVTVECGSERGHGWYPAQSLLRPLSHRPKEQEPCLWPNDQGQLLSWPGAPLPQQYRHGQGQGVSDKSDPHPHSRLRGSEQCPARVGKATKPLDRYPGSPIVNGLEKREGGSPQAIDTGGLHQQWVPGFPKCIQCVCGGGEGEPWLGRILHHPPELEQPFSSPRWVEEHSLLPRFHGDKAAQKVVESRGPNLLGFKSLLLHPQA